MIWSILGALASDPVRLPTMNCSLPGDHNPEPWMLLDYKCQGVVLGTDGRLVAYRLSAAWYPPTTSDDRIRTPATFRGEPSVTRDTTWGSEAAKDQLWERGEAFDYFRHARNSEGRYTVWIVMIGEDRASIERAATQVADAVRFASLSVDPLPPPRDLSVGWVDLPPADCSGDAAAVADGWIGLNCTDVVDVPELGRFVPIEIRVRIGFTDEARLPGSPLPSTPSRQQGHDATDLVSTVDGTSQHTRLLTVGGRERVVEVRIPGDTESARAAAARYVDAVIWPDL